MAARQRDGVRIGEVTLQRGQGGELHQVASGDTPALTTAQGIPVADDQNSLRLGERGPTLLEDFHFREKLFHFDHERIPERVVHARGYGAHGFFETYESLSDVTRADLFQRKGERTEVFVRFSTVAGSEGSADLARDVRGFAVKFYTKEGNWDLVGNNIPVFFIQDAIKFPDLIHAAKPEPDRGFPQAQTAHDNFWDFISLWNEALKLNGADPDFHRRDLWDAIRQGDHPEWELGLQLFDDDFADKFEFDVLDPTKIIPEEQVPVRRVGRMVLDRLVDNFFAETEQVAFCTQNIVPGIDFTNDPLLQGRNFSYLDTQLKRLGSPNFTEIPVNRPRGCPVHNFQQDGHMRIEVAPKGRANYQPNSWGEGPRESPEKGFRSFPAEEAGTKRRLRPESFADHYSQARQFYISQTEIERLHIASALTFELSKVETPAIRARVVSHLMNIDDALARNVASGLRLRDEPVPADAAQPTREDLPASPALSVLLNGPQSLAGRKVGALVADGSDAGLLNAVKSELERQGALLKLVAPNVGGIEASDGTWIAADEKLDGGPSVLFDAVLILPSAQGAAMLANHPAARDFAADAFAHFKFIGYTGAAEPLLTKAGIGNAERDGGCMRIEGADDIQAFVAACRDMRF